MISPLDCYKSWLIDIVADEDHLNYEMLFDYLFNTEFTWNVDGDENRAMDGIHLRGTYCDLNNQSVDIFEDGPCSILEMMVALSIRCSEDILWDGENDWKSFIFWSMIDNLKLMNQTDNCFNKDYVDQQIGIFLTRNYDENEVGGLFIPSHFQSHFPKSWRKMEIWYQLQNWINDKFL